MRNGCMTLETSHRALLDRLEAGFFDDSDVAALETALKEME